MPEPSTNLDLVRRSPFFAAAGEAAMSRLLRPSFTQQLPRGAIMFEQNEKPDFLHMLLSGSVGLTSRDESGAETIVEILRAGEIFLAPAVILDLPYLASGAALTDVRVLMIPAAAFREGAATDLAIAHAAMELLARHWRLMVDQVVDLKLRPADRRIARFLARRVAEEHGAGSAALPEPRAAIAARLGMTPETLSRTLNAMEADGLIRLTGKRIDVIDREKLLARRRQ
jgi:CRP/FNR family transcriptional activator FtrB